MRVSGKNKALCEEEGIKKDADPKILTANSYLFFPKLKIQKQLHTAAGVNSLIRLFFNIGVILVKFFFVFCLYGDAKKESQIITGKEKSNSFPITKL